MKTGNVPRRFVTRLNSLILVGLFIILAAVVAAPFYSAASSSLSPDKSPDKTARAAASREVAAKTNQGFANRTLWSSNYRALPLMPQGPGESIATFEVVAGLCTTTPKSSFNLGETVCAIVTGAPLGDPGRSGPEALCGPQAAHRQGDVYLLAAFIQPGSGPGHSVSIFPQFFRHGVC